MFKILDLVNGLILVFVALSAVTGAAAAQQVTGTPGSPSATTTIRENDNPMLTIAALLSGSAVNYNYTVFRAGMDAKAQEVNPDLQHKGSNNAGK